jgi:putative ABC transport system permease protein
MLNDLRYATRTLIKSPAFTIAALAALAIGIGATTAMFSAVNSVLLRPLPFPDAERLFVVRETRAQPGFEQTVVSSGEYLQWARNNQHFAQAAVVETPGLAVRLGDTPERIPALRVPADFFALFGVTPAAGRVFTRDTEAPGRGDVILLGYDLWQRKLSGAADVIGRSVPVEGRPTTVIGILPAGFAFGGRVDAIVPMTLGASESAEFSSHSLDLYARLAPGVAPQQAAADLTRLVLATQGDPPHATGVALVPLRDEVVGDSRASMLILLGAVGLVLLIACANIANLLLARAAARQREIAVRAALGATRGRVIRQLITESLLLSTLGGAMGIMLALWLTDLLARLAVDSIPRAVEISMDPRTVGFAVAISAICGLLFGVAPAWQAASLNLTSSLTQASRGGGAAGRARGLAIVVTAEIALALTLLVGAGLLLVTFRNLQQVDAGFDPSHVVTMPAYLPEWKYATAGQQRTFFMRAVSELAGIPGVSAAAAVNDLPLSGNNSSGAITPEGFPPPPPNQRESADRRSITPAYFTAMGIRVLQGRAFTDADNERSPAVLIVSRSLAEHYWPRESAIGKRLKLARYTVQASWVPIVGVVADVRHRTLARESRQVVYYPHAQRPSGSMELVVRSTDGSAGLAVALRTTMRGLDPDLPIDPIRPMSDLLRTSLLRQELEFGVLASFALLAVTLAAAGIYGVMSYTIALRAREFGIRLALGASGKHIMLLIAGHGLRVTAVGIASGALGAWAASSALAGLLYGVRPADPLVFGSTAALLTAIAMGACVVPIWRALRVNPIDALRGE